MLRTKQKALLLLTVLAISGCKSASSVSPLQLGICPLLPPVDSSLMQPETADFQTQMSGFLFQSLNEPTS
ncbi:Uncharacterised protein [Yersinia enterocolitica]|uniref:Lipoprotein n=1 Tax=Yersinia enterocolitica TaxID=630 RepID=A0ABP1YJG8_YEREN|nr:Uncharacterised protein [Yersinia enterocolitica]